MATDGLVLKFYKKKFGIFCEFSLWLTVRVDCATDETKLLVQ